MDQNVDMSTMVVVGEAEYPLQSIANLGVQDATPFRGFDAFPVGVFDFITKDVKLTAIDTAKKGMMAAIQFEYTCAAVHSLKDRSIEADELLGREYTETIFITDVNRDIGKVRALVEDSGGQWGNVLPQILEEYKARVPGMTAGITNYHNKESDKTYANLDYKSVKPLVQQPAPGMAPQQPAQPEAAPSIG